MRRILVALFGLLICGSAFSECVIYGYRPVYDENGKVTSHSERYVRYRWEGKCPEIPESEIRKSYIRGEMERLDRWEKHGANVTDERIRLMEYIANN